jgi:hypothetical protein
MQATTHGFIGAEGSLKTVGIDPTIGCQCLYHFGLIHVSALEILHDLSDVIHDVPASQDLLF